MQKMKKPSIILLILGIPLLFFGIKEIYQAGNFAVKAERTEGTIIHMRKGLTKYVPRVRFQTKNGQIIEFYSGNGSNPPMYEVNDKVKVLYNSDFPQYAVINSFIELWLGPVIYTGLGLFFVLFFIIILKKLKS